MGTKIGRGGRSRQCDVDCLFLPVDLEAFMMTSLEHVQVFFVGVISRDHKPQSALSEGTLTKYGFERAMQLRGIVFGPDHLVCAASSLTETLPQLPAPC